MSWMNKNFHVDGLRSITFLFVFSRMLLPFRNSVNRVQISWKLWKHGNYSIYLKIKTDNDFIIFIMLVIFFIIKLFCFWTRPYSKGLPQGSRNLNPVFLYPYPDSTRKDPCTVPAGEGFHAFWTNTRGSPIFVFNLALICPDFWSCFSLGHPSRRR